MASLIKQLDRWLDDRTGYRGFIHEALFERVPGGARWRYVWGSTLVVAFMTQLITGTFLWMAYSPSAQTAWESVYFIQFQMSYGWLLRGIHHYMATMMVVLLALHLMQVVIDGAYRAPREINFWLGLILMKIVLALALTGYLLPWDQKGYWATQVATKIAGIVPVVGPTLQSLIVGGNEYGHHTLTRFFALHAGVLPALLIGFLVLHIAMFRRHGLKAKELRKGPKRPDSMFWPDQVLKDAVAGLAVVITVGILATVAPAELTAPADPANAYDAARPEWYFLFLFQFLKFFHGETGEIIGAIVIPGVLMGMLFLMPILGRWKIGHRFNVAFLCFVMTAAGVLTAMALHEDYHALQVADGEYDDVEEVLETIAVDLRRHKASSQYSGKTDEEQFALYFSGDQLQVQHFQERLASYNAYMKSKGHLEAVEQAKVEGERARELASQGIPPAGNLTQVRSDPKLQGPKLFMQHCASCHDHVDEQGVGITMLRELDYPRDEATGEIVDEENPVPNAAPNLYGFGSRKWIAGLLDAEQIAKAHFNVDKMTVEDAPFFGNTAHREGEMVSFVQDTLTDLDDEQKEELNKLVIALSAEAGLRSQAEADAQARSEGIIDEGREALVSTFACTDCHKFHDEGDLGMAPDLTGYGSHEWLTAFISNPSHERFYPDSNDRMPAFASDSEHPQNNLLDAQSLGLIVDWLRGEWYEPTSAAAPAAAATAE